MPVLAHRRLADRAFLRLLRTCPHDTHCTRNHTSRYPCASATGRHAYWRKGKPDSKSITLVPICPKSVSYATCQDIVYGLPAHSCIPRPPCQVYGGMSAWNPRVQAMSGWLDGTPSPLRAAKRVSLRELIKRGTTVASGEETANWNWRCTFIA